MKTTEHNSQQIPNLNGYSSPYRLKASYQRNMLVGFLCATFLVGIPSFIIAWWAAGTGPGKALPPTSLPDTVIMLLPLDQVVAVIPERRPVATGSDRSHVEGALGTFVHGVVPVGDQLTSNHDQPLFGPGWRKNIELGYGRDLPGLGNGGWVATVFIPDTNIYELSAGLDRIPELVAMEKPEYPPLARRAGVEGTVILYIQVGIDGFVEDVEVVSETTPGYGFARYATETAWKAVFVPALYGSQPVRCRVSLPMEFVLSD